MTVVDVEGLFKGLVKYFRTRSNTVQSLAVMSANERWFQMEAAAFTDLKREEYGFGGGDSKHPMWWITCEHKKVDMWLANRAETAAVAIEFKAIHNNKNFRSKVCEVRYDLSDAKVTPATRAPVVRYAIIVCTFAWYTRGEEGNYVRSSMQPDQFKTAIEDELQSVQAYYVGLPTAHLVAWENICDLENAHYLETSKGCGVWLGLVKH